MRLLLKENSLNRLHDKAGKYNIYMYPEEEAEEGERGRECMVDGGFELGLGLLYMKVFQHFRRFLGDSMYIDGCNPGVMTTLLTSKTMRCISLVMLVL